MLTNLGKLQYQYLVGHQLEFRLLYQQVHTLLKDIKDNILNIIHKGLIFFLH